MIPKWTTNTTGGGKVVILKKKFPASAFRRKKIACYTNVIGSLWEKRENILPSRLLEKKFSMTRNRPPPPPPPHLATEYNNNKFIQCYHFVHFKEVAYPVEQIIFFIFF